MADKKHKLCKFLQYFVNTDVDTQSTALRLVINLFIIVVVGFSNILSDIYFNLLCKAVKFVPFSSVIVNAAKNVFSRVDE